MHQDRPHQFRINMDRPGDVRSGQIETDADIEVFDCNMHATARPPQRRETDQNVGPRHHRSQAFASVFR